MLGLSVFGAGGVAMSTTLPRLGLDERTPIGFLRLPDGMRALSR